MMDWLTGGPLSSEGTLHWTGDPWVVAAAVGVAGVALALTYRRGGDRRGGELLLWAVALVALVWATAEPQWAEETGREEPGLTVVLVDESRSMGLSDGLLRRSDRALSIVEQVGEGATVLSFGRTIESAASSDDWAGGTDIGAALESVADRYLGQQLASVVLVTDGIDRGGLRDAHAVGAMTVPSLPGPLTVYQVGRNEGLIDQAIEDVRSGGFAFLRTPFNLEAVVSGRPGERLELTLRREGRLVDTARVVLDEAGTGAVRFEVTPTEVGRFVWEVSMPVVANDGVPGNNRFPVVVRVVRDRTRVLQVSGSPSTDQKFLRLFLKEDPSVDLVSFFILRTHQDFGAGWYPDELSLIPFPYERLFTEQLSTFDVVVFQNFDFKPYFENGPNRLLGNIADFVRQGGAFVMIGGDRSFDLGEYAGTPIESILPVKLGLSGVTTDETRFLPVLTTRGGGHPVTRIAGSPADSELAWQGLPRQDGMNRNRGLSNDSAALLEHPELTVDGRPMPVLAVREVGEGRSMALMSDASWRWSFSEAAQGRGNQAYLRFWKGALRWLVADPDDRRVVVQPSLENVLIGDEMQVVVRVRDAGFGPVPDARVSGWVEAPDGKRTAIETITDGLGSIAVPVEPTEEGAHRVRVTAAGHGDAETVFSVTSRDPELAEIVPDTQFLEALAAAYGDRGLYLPDGSVREPLRDPDATRRVTEARTVSLASVPLVAVLFALCAGFAWWVRRRSGGR